MKSFIKKSLIYLIICLFSISCGGSSDDESNASILSYVESYTEILPDAKKISGFDLDSKGDIFMVELLTVANPAPIYLYNSDTKVSAPFEDSVAQPITGQNILIDDNDNIQVYYSSGGTKTHKTYQKNGNLISSQNITSADFTPGKSKAFTIDSEDSYFAVDTSGAGDGINGRYLDIIQFNSTLSTELNRILKAEILQLLPNTPDQYDVSYNDITCHNDSLYISVDMDSEQNKALDGILIFNNDLEYTDYLKGDWLFNFPHSIDFDENNNMYVSSTSTNVVKVFNSNMQLIARTQEGDEAGTSNGMMNAPTYLKVKNGKLYVYDRDNDRINVYNTY